MREIARVQRVAPLALTASVVAADTAGLHSLAFYLLLGAIAALAVPAQNAAQRQIARFEAGETLAEIYADEVLEAVRV